MIAVIWDKKTRKIIHSTQDENEVRSYVLFSHQDPNNFGFYYNKDSSVFPPSGTVFDSSGNLVPMSYPQLVTAGLAPALTPEQTLQTNQDGTQIVVFKSVQQMVSEGIMSIAEVKISQKSKLYTQATNYLNNTLTPQNKYPASDAAQKIALASLTMVNLSDSDPNKTFLSNQGLLYDTAKATEILNFCASVTASFRDACKAVDSAANISQIQAVTLKSFLT